MPFGVAAVITTIGKAMCADRLRGTPGTYTNPPKYIAGGVGATGAARTAVVGDTALSSELAEGRTSGTESTQTTTTTGDTYQSLGTITATGTRAVDEVGLFDASSSGNLFLSATHAVVNLVTGDSIQYTLKASFA
jgi:hypothetical protein